MANKVLNEAGAMDTSQLTGKTWRIRIIKGDKKGSSAFYPKEAVEAGAYLFKKGTRIYGDHPTSDEKWSRPERSYKDVIGVFESDAVYENSDLYTNVNFFSDVQEYIKERAEAGVIEMSIRANGDVEETADGPVLKAFTSVQSVDVVTTAGAGGGFDKLLESGTEQEQNQIETKESIVDEALKAALDELVESAKANAAALTILAEAETARKAAAQVALDEANAPKVLKPTEIAKALTEAKLVESAQARVLAAVDAGAELAEAIKVEQDIAKEVIEAAKASGATFAGTVNEELNEAKYDFASAYGE